MQQEGPGHPSEPQGASPAALAALVRELRASRGLTQLELARRADLSVKHVAAIERQATRPSRATVIAVADALDAPGDLRARLLHRAGFAPHALPSDVAASAAHVSGDDAAAAARLWIARDIALPSLAFTQDGRLVDLNASARLVLRDIFPDVAPLGTLFTDGVVWATLRERVVDFDRFAALVLQRAQREQALRRRAIVSFTRLNEVIERAAPPVVRDLLPIVRFGVRFDAPEGSGSTSFVADFALLFTTLGDPPQIALDAATIATLVPMDGPTRALLERLRTRSPGAS